MQAFEASQDLLFLQTPLEAMEFIVRLLQELIPVEAASACLYDIDTNEFRFVCAEGPGGEERRGEAVPGALGLMGRSAETEDLALRVDSPQDEEFFDPGIDGRVGVEPNSLLYMPLSRAGRLLGVLQLINRQRRGAFTQADVDLIQYVGGQAAQFLYNAKIAGRRR
ncbi:MAG: GAF domain-containing protein [Myxococcota bacterium]